MGGEGEGRCEGKVSEDAGVMTADGRVFPASLSTCCERWRDLSLLLSAL